MYSRLQIVFGLLCNRAGCPVAVEVFDGNTADLKPLGAQIEKLPPPRKLGLRCSFRTDCEYVTKGLCEKSLDNRRRVSYPWP